MGYIPTCIYAKTGILITVFDICCKGCEITKDQLGFVIGACTRALFLLLYVTRFANSFLHSFVSCCSLLHSEHRALGQQRFMQRTNLAKVEEKLTASHIAIITGNVN